MGHRFPERLCGLWHVHQWCTRTDSTEIGQEDRNWMREQHCLPIHPQQQVCFSFQLPPEFCSSRSAHAAAHHVHTSLGTQHLKCVPTAACLPGTADQHQAARRGARCPKSSPALRGNQRCSTLPSGYLSSTAPLVRHRLLMRAQAAPGTMQGV